MFVNYNTLITVMYLYNTISVHDIKEYFIKCFSNCIHIIVNEPMWSRLARILLCAVVTLYLVYLY